MQTVQIAMDFPGFAQEFLRRHPVYRKEYREVMTGKRTAHRVEQEEMAQRWGLSFPVFALSPVH